MITTVLEHWFVLAYYRSSKSAHPIKEWLQKKKLNQWTEHCTELYNHKANGDPSVLNCPQTDTEDDHPILRKEVEAAVQ